MRVSSKTREEAQSLIDAMRKGDVPAFQHSEFGLADRERIHLLIRLAVEHSRIQERYCNYNMSDSIRKRTETREQNLEKEIQALAAYFGLKARFDGNPRGFTVKLHAPQGNVWNTWGGAETGYGIGDRS